MQDVTEYLMKNYYAKYKGKDCKVVPTPEDLDKAILAYQDKIVIIREPEIRGVAIYLTLSDETYKQLEKIDISDVDTLSRLLKEQGDNIHFILLAADGLRTIMMGVNKVKKERKGIKTISWWNPDMSHLYKTSLN